MTYTVKQYLFNKGILVNDYDEPETDCFEVIFSLAKMFNISVTEGAALAHRDMIELAADLLGRHVPDAFYRGFPESVRKLTRSQLLFDQLAHYVIVNGFGCDDEAGHSLFERDFNRIAFSEKTEKKKFVILTEADANEAAREYARALLLSSRPLSREQYSYLYAVITEIGLESFDVVSRNTLLRLVIDLEDATLAKKMRLSEVVKLVDLINYKNYRKEKINRLNLKNRDRVFITKVIDSIFEGGFCNVRDCFERKKAWCGILHHIHYKPKCPEAEKFVALMRGRENRSAYSAFEAAMAKRDIRLAVDLLKKAKGSGALLRNLCYIISRCETEQDVEYVVSAIENCSTVILIQLILSLKGYSSKDARMFKYTLHNRLVTYIEKNNDMRHRKSRLTDEQFGMVVERMYVKLESVLKGRLGKVYIDPYMYKVTLPLEEATSNGGYGVLPRGTHLPFPRGKKLRAFTYWSRVNDIDLSILAYTEKCLDMEFSWRTMYENQSKAVTFSGDQVSGFDGGSEFYDIDLTEYKKKYPKHRYLIVAANVYSLSTFEDCTCRAGYMMRKRADSGEIFEPSTVKSSFVVNCDSSQALLFGIDLAKRELVWLNTSLRSESRIAATSSLEGILYYFTLADLMSVGKIATLMATEVVASPLDADVIIGDGEYELAEGQEQIRSCDYERINALIG